MGVFKTMSAGTVIHLKWLVVSLKNNYQNWYSKKLRPDD